MTKYHAVFLGEAQIDGANLYRIGSGVGLRYGNGTVYGELFEIPNNLWRWLDDIEGHPVNYKREIVDVAIGNPEGADFGWLEAFVYVHQYPFEKHNHRKIESGRYE